MGKNVGSKARPEKKKVSNTPKEGVFRFRVVEHLSWDNYDESKKCFIAGHEENKPIVGRKFKIKTMKGEVIDVKTDQDGVIELKNRESEEKFELIFEPEDAALNCKYTLLYNRCTLVETKL
ncbi:MAG: hypothetical protein WCA04_10195 [Geobacteraceae bacterium]